MKNDETRKLKIIDNNPYHYFILKDSSGKTFGAYVMGGPSRTTGSVEYIKMMDQMNKLRSAEEKVNDLKRPLSARHKIPMDQIIEVDEDTYLQVQEELGL